MGRHDYNIYRTSKFEDNNILKTGQPLQLETVSVAFFLTGKKKKILFNIILSAFLLGISQLYSEFKMG